MQVAHAIESRRAVKSFDPAHKMPADVFQKLIESVALAPSSFNIQHWRFVRLTDAATRQAVREAAWNQSQITDASEVLVVCGDIKAWEKETGRYWKNAPADKQAALDGMVRQFYQGRDWIQRDEVFRSGGIVGQTLMLAAQDLGYDSCPMIGFDQDAVAKIINLPADHAIVMILAIGKAVAPAYPRGSKLSLDDILFENKF